MGNIVLLGDPPVPYPVRLADRVMARMRSASLDAELAQGTSPETSRLLAARAASLVAPRRRQAAAANWEHLLLTARRRQTGPTAAVPLRAGAVIAAEPLIGDLARHLRAALPVPARGVAMAHVLLTDPTSPVYSGRAPVTLAAALEAALDQLDPARPLMPPLASR